MGLHVTKLLLDLGFEATTHAPCNYCSTIHNHNVIFLCFTDNFSIGCANISISTLIYNCFDTKLLEPLKRQGLITYYNGINIIQSQDFIQIACMIDIKKCLESHSWTSITPISLPINPSPLALHLTPKELRFVAMVNSNFATNKT